MAESPEIQGATNLDQDNITRLLGALELLAGELPRLSQSVSEASESEKRKMIAKAALRGDWGWIDEARASLDGIGHHARAKCMNEDGFAPDTPMPKRRRRNRADMRQAYLAGVTVGAAHGTEGMEERFDLWFQALSPGPSSLEPDDGELEHERDYWHEKAEAALTCLKEIRQAFIEWESGPLPSDDWPAEVDKVFADRVRASLTKQDSTYLHFGKSVHRPHSPGLPSTQKNG